MRLLRSLIAAIVLASAGLAATGLPARADDDGAVTIWAPYVVVGASTMEIWNVSDHPTWPAVTLYVRGADGISCYVGICRYEVRGPQVEPGDSWVFDPADAAPAGAYGGASIEARVETGTGANAGATSRDPDGRIVASLTGPTGGYDAVVAATEITLTDVGRRVSVDDGLTTAIQLVGAGGIVVDWYRDGELVVEQQSGAGAYCCGETGAFRTGAATIDPRDVDGLDDDARYTVVLTSTFGDAFAAVLTGAEDR